MRGSNTLTVFDRLVLLNDHRARELIVMSERQDFRFIRTDRPTRGDALLTVADVLAEPVLQAGAPELIVRRQRARCRRALGARVRQRRLSPVCSTAESCCSAPGRLADRCGPSCVLSPGTAPGRGRGHRGPSSAPGQGAHPGCRRRGVRGARARADRTDQRGQVRRRHRDRAPRADRRADHGAARTPAPARTLHGAEPAGSPGRLVVAETARALGAHRRAGEPGARGDRARDPADAGGPGAGNAALRRPRARPGARRAVGDPARAPRTRAIRPAGSPCSNREPRPSPSDASPTAVIPSGRCLHTARPHRRPARRAVRESG